MTSHKTTSKFVGLLFLAAMFSYGVGFGLVESLLAAPNFLAHIFENNILFLSGSILMMLNSCIVIGIGIFMFPILKKYNKNMALVYFSTRVIEALLLLCGIIALLLILDLGQQYLDSSERSALQSLSATYIHVNYLVYQWAMIILGLGSVLFCGVLYQYSLIPKPLALWGMIGYFCLFAGAVLELFGFPIGLMFSIPGGLFELFLPFWLFFKGFNIK